MPKYRKSGMDLLLVALAKLPWQLLVILAPISYITLHHYAVYQSLAAATTQQIGEVYSHSLFFSLCSVVQFILPTILMISAIASFVKRMRTDSYYRTAAANAQRGALLNMSWGELEQLVAEHFRRKGYKVTLIGGAGPDGGVDIELRQGSELSLVQCKQWRATAVGVTVVRELYGVMAARGAVSAYVVTSAAFTEEAKKFISGGNMYLIDGQALIDEMSNNSKYQGKDIVSVIYAAPPACPSCGSEMLKRVIKKGISAGNSFWGCQKYPACRGTRTI